MTSIDADQARRVLRDAERVYAHADIERALDRMSADITDEIGRSDPVVLTVLTGGIIPAGHLLTRFDFPLHLDYVHATRYGGGTAGGTLAWRARPATPLVGRCVLVVDDILDEGITLAGILDFCREQGAVLIRKRHDRCVAGLKPDFVGLEVDDRYVFGFGMDYHGYHRNLTGIFAVRE